MPPLGPIEAFEPALTRTRALLFRPFRLGRSTKLAICAYLALSGSLFFPPFLALPFLPHASFTGVLWLAAITFTVLSFALFYLGSRLQLVLFDLVVTLDPRIATLWRLRRPFLIWRWIAIKLAITLPLALVLVLPLGPALHRLVHLLPQAIAANHPLTGNPAPPPSFDPHLLLAVASLYALLFAAMSVLFFVSSLLSDFVLPVLALENSTARAALHRAVTILRSSPAAILGFLTFQILLTFVGLIAQYIAAMISALLAAIPLLLLALLGYLALHTIVPRAVLVAGGVLLYVTFLLVTISLQLTTFGTLMIFLRAYSLLFVAGHYSPLARWLVSAAPPPPFVAGPAPPPPFPLPSSPPNNL